MNTFIAVRNMTIRHRDGNELGPPNPISVSIGPVELFDADAPVKRYRCVVTSGPSPSVPTELFASDPISVLIAAIGAVESYCQMLCAMGEVTLECGRRFDANVDSVRSLSKQLWEPGFVPPFLSSV